MKNSNDLLVCSSVSQPATPKHHASVSVFLPYLSGMPIGSLLLRIMLSCVDVWPVWLYHVFLHDINVTIFLKNAFNIK